VNGLLGLVGWWVVLVPIGLALGFFYLYSVARQVKTGDAQVELARDEASLGTGAIVHANKLIVPGGSVPVDASSGTGAQPSLDEPDMKGSTQVSKPDESVVKASMSILSPARLIGKLFWYMVFALAILLGQVIIMPIVMLVVSMVMTIVPVIGIAIWVFGTGFAMYILLQLVFVIHGLLLGERNLLRAIWESLLLVRSHFWSVMGLLLLVLIVYQGLGRLWTIPEADSWVLLIGILANACVATGLAAATFIFYRERIPFIPQPRWASRKVNTE
jgi:hypothetical protein